MKKQLQISSLRKIGVHLGLTFMLLVVGLISTVLPVAAAPLLVLSTVNVGSQTGTLTVGTAGSATFNVTVSRTGTTPTTFNLSTTGLPPGTSAVFSAANPLSFSGSSRTVTLTINMTTAAAAGSTTFTVRAQSGITTISGTATLVISNPVAGTPTITFLPAPAPTYPGANFTVSATSNSNGALNYSVASGPCVVVNSTLGIFSPSGVGNCVIQANTTATLNFAAGSSQLNVNVTAGVSGPASSCPCDLWAKKGTLTLPDAMSINIYGYSATAGGAAGLPGPILTVNQGEAVNITLHNVDLPSATSLFIAEQAIPADPVGVTAGNNQVYSIPAGVLQPGTYLYEAGLTADGPRQVAMGLFGALIVRPAGVALTQAYADANSAFVDQAVLVLSEIDPAFNANPTGYDMTQFAPKYWLINGKGYPNTDPINVAVAGDRVLLRYLNAGLQHHSMGILGLHQSIIAADGKTVANPPKVVADTIPAGTTLDTIVTVPGNATANAKYALLDAAMHTDNKGILNTPANANPAYTPITFGGMLTFLTVGTGSTGGGGSAPVTSNVTLSPNPTSGPGGNVPGSVTLSATFAGAPDSAEYFVDTIGTSGNGCVINGSSASIPVSGANAPCADLTTLSSGNHTFYVHGRNGNGWGAFASVVLTLDKAGPVISGLSLSPNPANGTADVMLQATADDSATGNQNVIAAEYTIDGNTAVAITPNNAATVASLNAAIPAAIVAGLANGNHSITVRAQDALGNWGAFATPVTLVVDKNGPATSGVSATPNPANGVNGVQVSTGGAFYQRIDATISDVGNGNSNIVAAEYFIDPTGTPVGGTGGAMLATAGTFNGNNVTVYAAVELYAIAALTNGPHTICVRGEDAAGNWGPCATTTLNVDKVPPTVSNLVVNPNTPNLVVVGATNVPLNATATDAASAIAAAEYFIDTDPGQGLATPITTGLGPSPANLVALINGLTAGNHTIGVRARDAAGNWSAVVAVTVAVQNPLFANSFPNSNSPYGWTSVGGATARLSLSSAINNIKDANTRSLQASISSGTSGYVAHTLPNNPAVTSYHARFYVNPNGVALGTNAPTIFSAMNGNTTILQVQLRLNAGQYQVCAALCGTTTSWVTITGATAIEVVRNGTTLTMYVGGVLQPTSATVANSNITGERLGLQGALPTSSTNPVRLDAFISTRTAYIGP